MSGNNKTKHEQIVLANLKLLETLPNLHFSIDTLSKEEINRMTHTCWGCGIEMQRVATRCHVKAKSKGGSDQSDNYFLLCDVCHDEQPDGLERPLQEDWLQNRESWADRYAKVCGDLLIEMQQIAPQECLDAWVETTGVKKISKLIRDGYSSAAGWKNGRANAFALIKNSLKQFQGTKFKNLLKLPNRQ